MQVEDSVVDFDAAMAAAPQMRPYLWQRGLVGVGVSSFSSLICTCWGRVHTASDPPWLAPVSPEHLPLLHRVMLLCCPTQSLYYLEKYEEGAKQFRDDGEH